MNDSAYDLITGWILCRDPRLARLLENELAYLGVSTVVYPTLPPPSGEVSILVADGDEFSPEACLNLASACTCPLLLFGRDEKSLSDSREQTLLLRRPFALTAFEKAVRRLLPPASFLRPSTGIAVPASTPSVTPPPLPSLTVREDVVAVGEHTVTLTPAERSILEYLAAHINQTVTREELASLLGGGGNIVDVYVCRLRAKIEKPLGRRMIRTVRGVGYVLTE